MATCITQCPACGEQRLQPVVTLSERDAQARFLEYSRVKYGGLLDDWPNRLDVAIDRCGACGHCWYREQPSSAELAAMYQAGRFLLPIVAEQARQPTLPMQDEMRRLRRFAPAARTLLDYGSGFGRWARAAALEGFAVTAYEPAVSRGTETEKIEFEVVTDIERLAGRRFDVVNVEQVLEHTPDPAAELRRIAALCSPRTWLRVTVPNILRPPEGPTLWEVWPYDGKRAHIMAPFEHLHGFTPKSLRALVKRVGLCVVPGRAMLRAFPLRGLRDCTRWWLPAVDQTFVLLRLPTPRR